MRVFISESGRNQAWFDRLGKKEQRAYLEAHPHSKFGKKTAEQKPKKKSKGKKAELDMATLKGVKPDASKPMRNMLPFKNKLDALRKRLAKARPEDIPKIRLLIQQVREQIAAAE